MHFGPWVYIDFYVKMPLDGCSIPNTCAFIQIPGARTGACEGHTDKLFPVRKSLGGWGLTGSRWKICNNPFKLGSEFPWVKMFLSDIHWVVQYYAVRFPCVFSNRPCQNPLDCLQEGPWEFTLTSALQYCISSATAGIYSKCCCRSKKIYLTYHV